MPGISSLTLSRWECWVPSGSDDQYRLRLVWPGRYRAVVDQVRAFIVRAEDNHDVREEKEERSGARARKKAARKKEHLPKAKAKHKPKTKRKGKAKGQGRW
jgi:hypothetical protein